MKLRNLELFSISWKKYVHKNLALLLQGELCRGNINYISEKKLVIVVSTILFMSTTLDLENMWNTHVWANWIVLISIHFPPTGVMHPRRPGPCCVRFRPCAVRMKCIRRPGVGANVHGEFAGWRSSSNDKWWYRCNDGVLHLSAVC